MKKSIIVLYVLSALMLLLCGCGNEPKSGTAVISDQWVEPEASGESSVDLEGMTPADAMPAYSAYYAYDKDGNELFHELYWFDETGTTTDSDVTEPPEGAVIAYAEYTELDADGNELWSEHINY